MLTERQSRILNLIIDEYIDMANPVSSQAVFELGGLDISCPTIRNEMAALTEMGYLVQPHTSAGRVPTERGYRFFVDEVVSRDSKQTRQKTSNQQKPNVKNHTSDTAEKISEYVSDIVMFTNNNGELRYIGLKKLFSNPEFETRKAIVSIIEELERFETVLDDVIKEITCMSGEIEIFIGSENPFFRRPDYSMIVSPRKGGFISLIGPTRMDYRGNIAILEEFL